MLAFDGRGPLFPSAAGTVSRAHASVPRFTQYIATAPRIHTYAVRQLFVPHYEERSPCSQSLTGVQRRLPGADAHARHHRVGLVVAER